MDSSSLGAAMEREHHEIDDGIGEFIAGVAAGTPPRASLTRAMEALRRHIYLEEQFLFPPLRAAGMMAPIFVMLREHGEMWETLSALDAALTNGGTEDQLLQSCHALTGQLTDHNAKEEPILYPQIDRAMTDSAKADFATLLATASVPAGWVCTQARS